MDERDRLNDVADWYETEGFYAKILRHGFQKISVYLHGDRCLELGCADGAMTERIVEEFDSVVAVDGAQEHCTNVRDRLECDGLRVVFSLFEDFEPNGQFDTIIMAHVLEHVKEPVKLLKRVRSWLEEDGRLVIIVPNGASLHRQIGAEMELIEIPAAIDEHDEELGHRRVYTRESLHNHVRSAGLEIRHYGGIALKPLTNDQMNENLSTEIQDAYLEMGDEYPQLAAERYVVACP